jgi:hypothetical protein
MGTGSEGTMQTRTTTMASKEKAHSFLVAIAVMSVVGCSAPAGGDKTQTGEGTLAATRCGGSTSQASQNGITYRAYLGDGSADCPVLNSVYYDVSSAGAQSPTYSLGGSGVAHPVVVADPSVAGGVRFFVRGTDQALYQRTRSVGWSRSTSPALAMIEPSTAAH